MRLWGEDRQFEPNARWVLAPKSCPRWDQSAALSLVSDLQILLDLICENMREIRPSARIRQRGIGFLAMRNWKDTDRAAFQGLVAVW
jgi:hypothetical protein